MQKKRLIKWLIVAVISCVAPVTLCLPMPIDADWQQPAISLDCSKSYNNILRDLRDNWQSPISYLKKRGYIPKGQDEKYDVKAQKDKEECNDKSDDTNNDAYEFQKTLQAREDGYDNLLVAPGQPAQGNCQNAEKEKRVGFFRNFKDKLLALFGNKKQAVAEYNFDFEKMLQSDYNSKNEALLKGDIAKDAVKDALTHKDLNKDLNKNLNKEISKDLNINANKELNKNPNTNLNKNLNVNLNKDPSKAVDKTLAKEHEFNKDVLSTANKKLPVLKVYH